MYMMMSGQALVVSQCNSIINSSPTSENSTGSQKTTAPLSRYESQKRRDWNTFGQYLKNHKPPLVLSRCSGAHILEFLRYLDQFGKTKVHSNSCPFFGHPHPPAPCSCPLRQAWGSLDALVGRLRAAFEENGGRPEANPFGARAVRLYLREVRDSQAMARGIAYEKKKRKKPQHQPLHRQQQPQPPPVFLEAEDINKDDGDGGGGGHVHHHHGGVKQNLMMAGSSGARMNIIPLSVYN